jgi:hypothetical protein
MQHASLSTLVSMVRAEAGHSLSVAQGLNTLDRLKHVIRRTQYELWTAFDWPQIATRWDVSIGANQADAAFPTDVEFDQIHTVWWTSEAVSDPNWTPVKFKIPEDAIPPTGIAPSKGSRPEFWDIVTDPASPHATKIRVWPTPSKAGFLRLKGQYKLNGMVEDTDTCTLDATLIALFAAAEIMGEAKNEGAGPKQQKAQRHLQKLLANTNSDKQKVSTFGSVRSPYVMSHRTRIVV